jgi:hypothetical protein
LPWVIEASPGASLNKTKFTAEMVVDHTVSLRYPGTIDEFCSAYGTDIHEEALDVFAKHYTLRTPSAEEVFDEFVTRCTV